MLIRLALLSALLSRADGFLPVSSSTRLLLLPTRLDSTTDSFYGDSFGEDTFAAGPTEKQVAFANRLASERGIDVPVDAATSSVAMSQFIETCLQQPVAKSSTGTGGVMSGESRPPSDKQVAFAARLAAEKGLAIPPEATEDSQRMSQFIESALSSAGGSFVGQSRGAPNIGDNGDLFHSVDLGRQRSARVRTFAGKVMVDVREFYDARGGGTPLPTKKGIALSAEEWQALKAAAADIDAALIAAQASVGAQTIPYPSSVAYPPTAVPQPPLASPAFPTSSDFGVGCSAPASPATRALEGLLQEPAKEIVQPEPWVWNSDEAERTGGTSPDVPF